MRSTYVASGQTRFRRLLFCSFSLLLTNASLATSCDFPDGLWSHRNNTLDAIERSAEQFSGIEMDAFYDDERDRFVIKRYSDGIGELTLLDVLNHFTTELPWIWLDLKNLDASNAAAIGTRLQKLNSDHSAARFLLIESSNSKPLAEIGALGFRTLYWVPHYEDFSWFNQLKFAVRTLMTHETHCAVSAHYRMLPHLERFYPNHRFYLWVHFSDELTMTEIERILEHQNVSVVLVDNAQLNRH